MKTAIIHDWLTGMRGGERCLELFCELFPDAELRERLIQKGLERAKLFFWEETARKTLKVYEEVLNCL